MSDSVIAGMHVVPLRRIPDERGTVMHMVKATDPFFDRFGEIYFSTVYQGAVKGWHRHADMTLRYAVPHGRIKHVVYDDRPDSPTRGALVETFLGPEHYALVIVPPGVWNGFKGLDPVSLVANCASHPHDPTRSERADPHSDVVPYRWERVDR